MCGKVLRTEVKLLRHLEIHVCPKAAQCVYCGKWISTEKKLNIHINTHHGYRPYLCPHTDCHRRWVTPAAVKSHLRHFHRETNFTIQDCEKFLKPEEAEGDSELIIGSLEKEES